MSTIAETLDKVYPRVCGGNLRLAEAEIAKHGLSPRVRGKPPWPRRLALSPWSIPACAGETVHTLQVTQGRGVYPRVCGGNCRPQHRQAGCIGLSPRVRGKRQPCRAVKSWWRSIPACAGETNAFRRGRRFNEVYPRVCGGNRVFALGEPFGVGLSPRVRGKRWRP